MEGEKNEAESPLPSISTFTFEDNPEDVKQAVSERWNMAISEAKQKLKPSDYATIRLFPSADALLNDLQCRQEKLSKDAWLSTRRDISPAVKALHDSVATFLIAIAPRSLEFAVMWGLIYLATTLSLKSKSIWMDFVKRLQKIRRSLVLLNLCARLFHDSFADELSRAMVSVFASLIEFWVQTVNWMRDNPSTPRLPALTGQLESKFSSAMEEVEESINHLKTLASIMNPPLFARFERLESERRARQDELASNLDVSDDLADYPVNLLPMAHLSAVFQGREEVLVQIDEALDGPESELRSVLIHGLGGVGKTQTALNYAHRNAAKYDAIFWVRSETTLSINASMSNIARSLKLPGSMREDGNDEMNFLMVQSWFRTQAARKKGRKWLVIFDNVESIEDIDSKYVPTTGGAVIITSRRPDNALPTSSEISLKPFSIKAATKVLSDSMKFSASQVLDDLDKSALTALATKVDGLPIGLRVIAGLMNVNARKNTTASKFLYMYNKGAVKLMKTSGRIIDYEGDSTRRVGSEHVLNRIWFLSFEQLDKSADEKGEARILLGILALLCPDGVPQSLFGPGVTENDTPQELLLVCEDELAFDTALVGLVQMALADLDGSNITIHRLVQDAYIEYLLETDEKRLEIAFESVVYLLQEQFPRQVNGRPMHGEWQKCRELIEHARWLAERFSEVRAKRKEFPIPRSLAELLKHCAWYLFEMADHRTALHMLEIAQSACADKNSELYAHLLNTVGCCSFELNELQRCRQTWEEALSLRKSWAKKNAPGAEEELANQLNNFGNLESAEGNYDVALDLFDSAKKIRVQLEAEAIVPLAVSHMTTGRAYFLKGMPLEAMDNYKQAEDIFLDQFGPKAHFMAHLNYAYGNLKLGQNPKEANEFFERARAILEETTPYHLLLAACLYKMACLRASSSDRDQALDLINKGLTIAEFREAVGDTARLLRKKAAILSEGSEDDQQSAELLIVQVESMLAGQAGLVVSLDGETEDEWNNWVCPYWR